MTFRGSIKNLTIKNFYKYKYNYALNNKKNKIKNMQKQWRNNNKITVNKTVQSTPPVVTPPVVTPPVTPEGKIRYFIMEDNVIECDDEYIQRIIKNGGL